MPLPENKDINRNEPQAEGVIDINALDEDLESDAAPDIQPEEEKDYYLGEELLDDLPFLMQGFLKEENGEVLFDKLVENGCIRSVGGKKFTKTGAEGADEIARDIRNGKKYVFYTSHSVDPAVPEGKPVRIADITFNKDTKNIVVSPDTPDRGTDYSIPYPEEMEDPEASEELIAFARKLKASFDAMDIFRWDKPGDLARVKVYYTDEKGNTVEKNAFASWYLRSNGTGSYELMKDDKLTISPLYSAAEKDMADSDYPLDRFLEHIEKDGAEYFKRSGNGSNLVHIYAI